LVDQFEGALPENRVRAWLRKLVPSDADRLADEAARVEERDPEAAAVLYRQALEADATHSRSLLGLGRVLAMQADPDAADVLRKVGPGTPEHSTAQALLDLVPLMTEDQRLASNSDDLEARWTQAAAAARTRDWQGALDLLLSIVQRERGWRDGVARRAMLAIFALLGEHHPLAQRYRQQLASVLFG
jgi:putative thioredoxin